VLLTAGLTLSAPAKAAGTAVTVSNPWIRFIIRARPAAGYFTLNNSGNTPVQLIGAASPACGMLMLHQSQEVNGVEKMRPVKKVAVPAHGSVAFTPGHYHLMCMKPAATMARGKNVPVTLKFGDGTSLTADFPVRGAGDK
jgi:copper(I)-binding protein